MKACDYDPMTAATRSPFFRSGLLIQRLPLRQSFVIAFRLELLRSVTSLSGSCRQLGSGSSSVKELFQNLAAS
jgi:hypothetical protein